eukprot:gene47996-34909_t
MDIIFLGWTALTANMAAKWVADGGGDKRPGGPDPLRMGWISSWLAAAFITMYILGVTLTRQSPLWANELIVALSIAVRHHSRQRRRTGVAAQRFERQQRAGAAV